MNEYNNLFDATRLSRDLRLASEESELDYLKSHNFDSGFMSNPSLMLIPNGHRTVTYTNEDVPFQTPPTFNTLQKRGDLIENTLTAREYRILTDTKYYSSKEQIKKFHEIIGKLLDAGAFDDVETKGMNPWVVPATTQYSTPQKYAPFSANKVSETPTTTAPASVPDPIGDVDVFTIPDIIDPMPNKIAPIMQAILSSKQVITPKDDETLEVLSDEDNLSPVEEKSDKRSEYTGSYIEITYRTTVDEYTKELNTINTQFVGIKDFVLNNVIVTGNSSNLTTTVTICLDDLINENETFDRVDKLIETIPDDHIQSIRFRTNKVAGVEAFLKLIKMRKAKSVSVFKSIADDHAIIAFMTTSVTTKHDIIQMLYMSKDYYDINNK